MVFRPIHFSVPMVRALIEGRKSQTRRIATSAAAGRIDVGDQLWVREAYRLEQRFDQFGSPMRAMRVEGKPLDYEFEVHIAPDQPVIGWGMARTARTMPKVFSRLILTVTEVRRQPLHALTEADAIAEGVDRINGGLSGPGPYRDYMDEGLGWRTAVRSYESLWTFINGRQTPWEANPDVIAITFTHRLARVMELEASGG